MLFLQSFHRKKYYFGISNFFLISKIFFRKKSNMLRNAVKKTSIRSVSADLVTPPPWDLSELRQKWRTPGFPVKELQHFTEGDNQEKRQKFRNVFESLPCFWESSSNAVQGRKHLHRELLAQPEFVPQYNIPLEQVKQEVWYGGTNKLKGTPKYLRQAQFSL